MFEIDQTPFVDNKDSESIIKVIGVGGGGNNAINHMYKQGVSGVSFVVCNTDKQALNHSAVPTRVLIGPNTTFGRGAGNKPELARDAAEESADEINRLFDDETKMVFITAGMGGGTGTGAAPVVARIARDRGLLTIGIVTIPFLFEGESKIRKAFKGADEMAKFVDALLVINNERLTEIYRDLNFINAFAKADDTLTTAARSISELISINGHINLDFNDVDTTLRNGGLAIISTGYAEGENRVTNAIKDALNSPLLKDSDIKTSKHLLFNIYIDPNAEQEFKMDEANELTAFTSNIYPGVDVIWGIAFDETLGNKVKISVLASGFGTTVKVNNAGGNFVYTPDKQGQTADETATAAAEPDNERLVKEYGKDKIAERQRAADRMRYIVLTPEQMDDDRVLIALENSPAYNRDPKIAEQIRKSNAESAAQKVAVDNARNTNHNSSGSGDLIVF
ncbi:MAG: cell division protein FtsZ [Muribaculaceae bacterium]|nr:cell division protein FtsZ [Muribaculaceae bacterium]